MGLAVALLAQRHSVLRHRLPTAATHSLEYYVMVFFSRVHPPFDLVEQPAEHTIVFVPLVDQVIQLSLCAGPTTKNQTNAQQNKPQKAQVLVLAEVDASNIVVVNANDFDWIAPKVMVWDGVSGYQLNYPGTIKAKDKKVFRLSDFISGTKRFDGTKSRPDQITISTDTAGGGMKLQ